LASGFPNIEFSIERPTVLDFITASFNTISVPITKIKILPDDKETFSLELKVNKKFYEYIKTNNYVDEFTIFYNFFSKQLGFWGPDMMIGVKILSELKLISNIEDWIKQSRHSLELFLSNQKVISQNHNDNSFKIATRILKELDILEEIQQKSDMYNILIMLVKDLIKKEKTDYLSIIYRVSITIYHTKNNTGKSFSLYLDDPTKTYFKLIETNFYKENKDKFLVFESIPVEIKLAVVKFLIAFIIGIYVYYKGMNN
jgi:hypothetical protein